ncbi:MAG: hypothetical protein KDA78_16210, partial [Planctomycetaceae bacterium]|nr:hypothetical protein [Planctomycetaceae bacterium]
MRAFSRAVCSTSFLVLILGSVASADPWIEGVKPRLIGRGTTSEIIISRWRNEALELIFYPQKSMEPVQGNQEASGIHCVGTRFDPDKNHLVCQL